MREWSLQGDKEVFVASSTFVFLFWRLFYAEVLFESLLTIKILWMFSFTRCKWNPCAHLPRLDLDCPYQHYQEFLVNASKALHFADPMAAADAQELGDAALQHCNVQSLLGRLYS